MDFFEKIEEYEKKASNSLEAKVNIFIKLLAPELEQEVRSQIEKEIQDENQILTVYMEVKSSEKVRKILENKTNFISNRDGHQVEKEKEKEIDPTNNNKNKNQCDNHYENEIFTYDIKNHSNRNKNREHQNSPPRRKDLTSNFNQENLFSSQKIFSLENEILINFNLVISHLDRNITYDFFSYINSLCVKQPKIKKVNKKEKSFGSMVSHIPQSISGVTSPNSYNKRINDCINNLYPLPEIKPNHFLNTEFVNKKTHEFRFHGNLNIRLNMNEYKKKFKLKPLKYDLDVEKNLKIVDEILTKKKCEDNKNEKAQEKNFLLADTTSKYYIKLNRNILGRHVDDKDPIKLKKTQIKPEYNFFTNVRNHGKESKKRILSSRYKIINDLN